MIKVQITLTPEAQQKLAELERDYAAEYRRDLEQAIEARRAEMWLQSRVAYSKSLPKAARRE